MGGGGCIDPSLLTLAVDGGEWSASRPGRFTPGESASTTHWVGGCVGTRTSLGTVKKWKISCPYRQSNLGCPARNPSRRHGHRDDKNGVYFTSHLFFTWFLSLIASFMRACSYQLNPFANRVALLEWCSRGQGPSERTPRKTPPHCYLWAAAWERNQQRNSLTHC
jgi:hypothetical protein